MRFEWQGDEFCMVPAERDHEVLYEAVELALDGAATGGAPLTPEQAETYLYYHRLGPRFKYLPIGIDAEDLHYPVDCLDERAIDLTGEGSYGFARDVVAQMRQALDVQDHESL